MFPTDRWKWSTQDGAKHTPKESFVLPPNWKWENEWMIDSMVPGDEEVIMRCWGGGGGGGRVSQQYCQSLSQACLTVQNNIYMARNIATHGCKKVAGDVCVGGHVVCPLTKESGSQALTPPLPLLMPLCKMVVQFNTTMLSVLRTVEIWIQIMDSDYRYSRL